MKEVGGNYAEGNKAYTVSFLTVKNRIVISATLH